MKVTLKQAHPRLPQDRLFWPNLDLSAVQRAVWDWSCVCIDIMRLRL